MSPARPRRLAPLAFLLAVPMPWLACGGGETKPPESPAGESSAAASSEAPAGSDTASAAASASSDSASNKPDKSAATSPSTDETAASSPPPPPSFGTTDCGKCVDKTCAKPEAACGKNSDCQLVLDTIRGCSATAASCIGAASPPTAAKPKKLAAAVESCEKKAIASKACKAKCQ